MSDSTEIQDSQVGIVGNDANVKGGIHHHASGETVTQTTTADHGSVAINTGDVSNSQIAARDIVNKLASPWVVVPLLLGYCSAFSLSS